MDKIPVEYYIDNIAVNGHFKKVSGSGTLGTYHLLVDGHYKGQAVHSDDQGWQFTSNDRSLQIQLAKWFQNYIQAIVNPPIPDQE